MSPSNHSAASALALLAMMTSACCTPTPVAPPAEPAPVPVVAPPPATYDVHEWGLVRATLEDHVMLSGPHANAPMMGIGKPVLYFHRIGEGALEVDVSVHIEGGRIVEHWPMDAALGEPGSDIDWRVQIGDATCSGSRYPAEYTDEPCRRLLAADDICEAATLRAVETTDASCLTWASGGQSTTWNHLFYRAELQRDPMLPLVLEPGTQGSVRLSSRGMDAIGGSILRVVRGHGARGIHDAAIVLRAPQHGETIDVPAPTGSMADAMSALDASLREAGLTADETAAFRRAWDETLFGAAGALAGDFGAGEGRGGLGGGVIAHPTDSILYVLPASTAESLSTLRLTPAPREIRRVIVAWVDVPATH